MNSTLVEEGEEFANGRFLETKEREELQEILEDGEEEDLTPDSKEEIGDERKRKKRSYKKRNHYCPTLAEIRQTFHLPLEQAAASFNICVSKLKKLCREHGITRWPYRKMKSVEVKVKTIQELKQSALQTANISLDELDEKTANKRTMCSEHQVVVVEQNGPVSIATVHSDKIEKQHKTVCLKPMRKYLQVYSHPPPPPILGGKASPSDSLQSAQPVVMPPQHTTSSPLPFVEQGPFVRSASVQQFGYSSTAPMVAPLQHRRQQVESSPPPPATNMTSFVRYSPPYNPHHGTSSSHPPVQQQHQQQQSQQQQQPFYRRNVYMESVPESVNHLHPNVMYNCQSAVPVERLPSIHELLHQAPPPQATPPHYAM